MRDERYVGPSLATNMLMHFNRKYAKRSDDVCHDAENAVDVRNAFETWRRTKMSPLWTEQIVSYVFRHTFDVSEAYDRLSNAADMSRAIERHRTCVKILSDAVGVPFFVQMTMTVLEMATSTERTIRGISRALSTNTDK